MKPKVLRELAEVKEKIDKIIINNDGKKFLADDGTYKLANGGSTEIVLLTATQDNQKISITPVPGSTYLIESSSYTGVNITLSSTSIGYIIYIKNIHATKKISFNTALDGEIGSILDPLNGVRLMYDGNNWWII
jgi:hypothetical protein